MSRIAGRNFLFVPGPTNVPERILRAMHRAMEDHRSSAFPELTLPLLHDLKQVFKTATGQVFVFPGTGTGGWETALTNTLSPGDRVLAPRFGQFSHLWIDLAQRIGVRVDILDVEWGEGAPVERIEEILTADRQHEIKGVLIVHNETATGVTSDVAGVRRALDAAGHPGVLYVDGVSSIASIDFRMDDWKVDVAVTGSQKGLMLPAGLAVVCASSKALAARERAKCARVYFDFGDMTKANASGYFPYTPSLPMLYGLREAVDVLLEEGLENVFARHHRLAEGVRAAVKAWGLRLCARAPKWDSDTVSAIMVPEGINGADVIDVAFRRYNLALGAGLARLAGQVFRVGPRHDPATTRLQRSEFAVPGSNPALFRKALESEADYVFLDLEDAVAPADKEQARKNVVAGLLEHDWRERGKTICVRINGIDTHYMYRDVVDVVEQAGHRLDVVLLPKVGVPAGVYLVDALLTQIEAARRIPPRGGVEVVIEPAGGPPRSGAKASGPSTPRRSHSRTRCSRRRRRRSSGRGGSWPRWTTRRGRGGARRSSTAA